MSTSLGPKWRLCNGDLVSADQYPDYVNVAKSNPIGLWKKANIGTDTLYTATYGNGYWVVGGTNGKIYYTTDPLGSWTSKTIGSSGIFHIAYANGYWVAFTYAGTGKIYYCSSAPTGTWTAIDPPALSGYQWGYTFLKYVNGYWVLSYYTKATTVADPYYGIKYRTTLPIDGTWLDGTTATIGNEGINDITYGGGYWVLSTSLGRLNYSNQAAPTGFTANLQSLAQNYGKIRYGNGYWCTIYDQYIYYKTGTPAGNWTKGALVGTHIDYDPLGGYWVGVAYNVRSLFYRKDDPIGGFTSTEQTTMPSSGGFSNLVCTNGVWFATFSSNVGIITGPRVPTIALEAYAYVKVLE